jgi:hypothetical protein
VVNLFASTFGKKHSSGSSGHAMHLKPLSTPLKEQYSFSSMQSTEKEQYSLFLQNPGSSSASGW